MMPKVLTPLALAAAFLAAGSLAGQETWRGWLSWRGPQQDGTSKESSLPGKVSETAEGSWQFKLRGRGTPVIANGRVFAMGYEGTGEELQEMVICLDEKNGKEVWRHRFTDFLSDVIYERYAIGSPTIDPDSGDVFCMSTGGLLTRLSRNGAMMWQRSMASEYGRLTFPNGRTGAPLIVGDLCIVHIISSGWGPHGPARDRFYAFDKKSGEPIWSCTPGGPPKDSSFCFPVVGEENGKPVVYAGLGGGHMVCVDVRTGDPLWKFQMAIGGVNSSPLLYKGNLIAIHGKENIDDSSIGRLISIRRGAQPQPGEDAVNVTKTHENWRAETVAFTSSPVLVGNRVFVTGHTGEFECFDADTGKKLWHKKLAPDQIHASPAAGDGKLYVPMNNGGFYILEPSDEGVRVLQEMQLAGNCLGAPAIANGRIYVHTTEKLYCFAGGAGEQLGGFRLAADASAPGAATRLQVVPGDIVVVQGQTIPYRARSLDAMGRVVEAAVDGVEWKGLPPKGVTIEGGRLLVAKDATPSASMVQARKGSLAGSARLRIVRAIPYTEDFSDAVLKPHPTIEGLKVGRSPSYWVGAGPKWETFDLNGEKVLAKTLDNPLFQRTATFFGYPSMRNYTVQADIMTDGNRRIMSSGGVINQRYLILLKGNHQELEVSSNMELLKQSVKFSWQPKTWYRLKTRVDLSEDGSSGVVRAKVWKRSDPEPGPWTIEVPHKNAHTQGSPGIYGFVPQSRFRVYIDNISVTSND